MKSKWTITDLKEVQQFLGLQIDRDWNTKTMSIHQEKYVIELLDRFDMNECHSNGRKVCTCEGSNHPSLQRAYWWIEDGSARPDISFSVHKLAQFNENHERFTALTRILRYLKATSSKGLKFGPLTSSPIIGFCDANWAGDNSQKLKSISGNIFYLCGKVSWMSKKQGSVAVSSCEPEYVSMSEATSQGLWLSCVLKELQMVPQNQPFYLYCDNESAIHTAENPVHHGRMKHIEIRFHMVREKFHESAETPVPSRKKKVDALTKALALPLFTSHVASLFHWNEGIK